MLQRDFVAINRQIWGIDNPAMLAGQIEAESGWRDGQVSTAAARGICQSIEPTAVSVEVQYPELKGLARYSPRWCLEFQARHVRDLHARFRPGRGDCSALLFAFGGYVGSPGTLEREIALCKADADCNPSRWFGNVEAKQARADRHFRDSRFYVLKIFTREPEYADAGFGARWCN